jgi:hypothetical protein
VCSSGRIKSSSKTAGDVQLVQNIQPVQVFEGPITRVAMLRRDQVTLASQFLAAGPQSLKVLFVCVLMISLSVAPQVADAQEAKKVPG